MPDIAELPSQVGRYRIVRKLGAGGMGAVFLAQDTALNRQVALKMPLQEGDPTALRRFVREARVAAQLTHPNLCPIHDIGDWNGLPFFVMPFLKGEPLARLMDKPWPARKAAALVYKVANAVAVLHQQDEEQHQVEFSHDYYLGEWPVTQAQFQAVMGRNPSWYSRNGTGADAVQGLVTDDFPVEDVSWETARKFCAYLTERCKDQGVVFRLPTEAEWEYACRAGAANKDTLPLYLKDGPSASISAGQVNFDCTKPYGAGKAGVALLRTCQCGTFPQAINALGLADMHGNVWQWCEDLHDTNFYKTSPKLDPRCDKDTFKGYRILRGSSYSSFGYDCRAAARFANDPGFRDNNGGFRVCCVKTR